jgi:type I restriction enzyme S subunit
MVCFLKAKFWDFGDAQTLGTTEPDMSEWKEYKLGDLVDLSGGFAFKSKDYATTGRFILRTLNIAEDGRISRDDAVYLPEELCPQYQRFELQPFDTLFVMVGATLGKIGFVRQADLPALLNQNMWLIRAKPGVANPQFLHYAFRYAVRESLGWASGSAREFVRRDDYRNLRILLPPLPEQRAIASVLSSLDDKIDLLHRQNKTLEALAETLFRQWFVEEAEERWEMGKLGDFLEETIGGEWGEDEFVEGHEPVYCLRGVDIQKIKENGFSGSVPVRFVRSDRINKRILSENEILLAASGVGPIGRTLSVHRDLISSYPLPLVYSNFCKRLRAKNKYEAFFWEYLLYQMYKEGEMDRFHTGTSIPNFDTKGLLNLQVSIPPEKKRVEFGKHLDMWYQKKFSQHIRALTQMRDTLLPKLMRGEVRVKL